MKIEIHAKPIFWMELNVAHINVLMKASKSHYDSTCQEASERGGFIYGWNNWVSFVDEADRKEPVKVNGSFSNLDICLKILEMDQLLTKEERVIAAEIRTSFTRALMTSNAELSKVLVALE